MAVSDVSFRGYVPVKDRPLRGHRHAAAHRIGRLRPSLFAYQFVVAATPA
jgi:hypothetical protein